MDYYFIVASFFGWIVVSGWGAINVRRYWRTILFAKADAEITSISTSVVHDSDSDVRVRTVSYKFEVNGKNYRGNSGNDFIGYVGGGNPGQRGDSIKILYNPEDPAENYSSRKGLYIGIVIVCMGLCSSLGA